MKIVSYDIVVVGAPWRKLCIVELKTESGLTGLSKVRMVNKTDTLIAAICELAERYIIGMDAFNLTKPVWQIQNAEYGLLGEVGQSALAAFNIACWNIWAKPATGQYGSCLVANFVIACQPMPMVGIRVIVIQLSSNNLQRVLWPKAIAA